MLLEIVMAGAAVISAVGTGSAIVLLRTRMSVDKGTVEKLKRELAKEDDEKNRGRMEADERRTDRLRDELAELTERNNEQFNEILDLHDEVAELREWANDHKAWDNEAVRRLKSAGIDMPMPPALQRHTRRSSRQ